MHAQLRSTWRAAWRAIAAVAVLVSVSACGKSTECAEYSRASVAEMRVAGRSGCFEFAHVALIARTSSATVPRIYVQDPGGGDFSAIMAKCDQRSAHACPAPTAAKVLGLPNGAATTVRGYYQQGAVSELEELYLDEVVDEGMLLPLPPPVSLKVADLARGARARAQWFQIANIAYAEVAGDPLAMYDFSPPEFALKEACPTWEGFGMIPASAGAAGAAGCAGSANPAGRVAPDPREILIGRQFFREFFASTDCRCAVAGKHLLSPGSIMPYGQMLGPIGGILILELSPGSSTAYQVFEPLSKALFPVGG